MLNAEQIKLLEDLGFKIIENGWRKDYRKDSYIIVRSGRWITIKHIEEIDEAISDFSKLREGGII